MPVDPITEDEAIFNRIIIQFTSNRTMQIVPPENAVGRYHDGDQKLEVQIKYSDGRVEIFSFPQLNIEQIQVNQQESA